MSKTRSVKAATVEILRQNLASAKCVAFVNFAGLNVKDVNSLRRQCRAAGVNYIVAKKTLLEIAFKKDGISVVNPRELSGGVAAVFGTADEISAAKVINEFIKNNSSLKFVGGLIRERAGWQFLTGPEVTALANLPGRRELVGQLARTILNPLRGFVGVLSGNSRSLVRVLQAIAESRTS